MQPPPSVRASSPRSRGRRKPASYCSAGSGSNVGAGGGSVDKRSATSRARSARFHRAAICPPGAPAAVAARSRDRRVPADIDDGLDLVLRQATSCRHHRLISHVDQIAGFDDRPANERGASAGPAPCNGKAQADAARHREGAARPMARSQRRHRSARVLAEVPWPRRDSPAIEALSSSESLISPKPYDLLP